jgi:LytS/YehU family sensor histidine kinase
MEQLRELTKLLDNLANNLGIQIGFVMGVLHEIYRHNYQGIHVRWALALTNILAAVLMGWVVDKIGRSADLSNLQLGLWIGFMSLNTFLVINVLTNKEIVQALISHYVTRKKP